MDVSTCPRTYVHWTHPPLDYPVSLVLPTARTPPCRSVPRHSFPSPCSGRLDSSLRPLRDLSFLTAAKTGTLVTDVIPVTYLTVAWAFGRGPPLPNIERAAFHSRDPTPLSLPPVVAILSVPPPSVPRVLCPILFPCQFLTFLIQKTFHFLIETRSPRLYHPHTSCMCLVLPVPPCL